MKNIAILGSTGSIGQNTLDVIAQLGDDYRVHSLAAKTQVEKLAEQARLYHPRQLAIGGNDGVSEELRRLTGAEEVALFAGDDTLVELAQDPEVDVVVNALVGAVGLRATLAALQADKVVALANKESIVMAGSLVMEAASGSEGLLIPIDSEHSAVLQCLRGENPNQVGLLILTASGGPFLRTPYDRFAELTPEEALKHPNWEMGQKITIDSATMMNKGLEVIEAHYLFSLPPDRIQVVIHPQSVVHSLVEFIDGSLKAQLSMPDMRIPIQYALTYPDRQPAEFVQNDRELQNRVTRF
jgi:1-deoxy-D-xylulose-5-phosphate reductoisomerase